jgi:hypothetical protein
MRFPPGTAVHVRMHNGWHKGKVIGPTRSWHDYTTVKVYDFCVFESSDWCVPTRDLLPGVPYGFGISIHRAAQT